MATAVRTWLPLGVVTGNRYKKPSSDTVLFSFSIQGWSHGGAHFEKINGAVCI